MVTRIIEILQLTGDNSDHTAVKNWLSRLESAIEIALFSNSDQLPTEQDARVAMTNNLKKNYLLASIGPVGFKYLRSYCSPDEPSAKTYDELVQVLKVNLAPVHNVIAEEYQFTQLKQEAGETLASYYSRVKEAASMCDFETKFDQMVRNRFIYGLRDSKIRTSLLSSENDQTAQQIFNKAIAKEQASTSNMEMSGSSKVNNVQRSQFKQNNSKKQYNQNSNKRNSNTAQGSGNRSSSTPCAKCTVRGHKASDCRVKCNYCKQFGHIVKNCPKSMKRRGVNHVGEGSDGMNMNDVYGSINDEEDPRGNLYQVQWDNFNHIDPRSQGESCVPMHKVDEANVCYDVVPNESTIEPKSRNDFNCFESGSNSNLFLKNDSYTEISKLHPNNKNLPIESNCNSVKLNSKPLISVMLNGKYATMEVDTGAAVSCISSKNFDKLKLTGCSLDKCNMNLCVANGNVVKAEHKALVVVKFREYSCNLPLYVVNAEFPTLLGLEWIQALFGEDWLSRMVGLTVNHVQSREAFIEEVKKSVVFQPGMGNVTGVEACIDLKPGAVPKFCKARPPPFAHAKAIENKIDDLVREGVLEPVDHSEYASPVHPVIKPDGDVRLCGDYKRTLNPNIDSKIYPLPVIEDCLWEVRGGDVFTKLDIKQAYNHLPVRKCDRKLTTINTHKGLYQWTRLPYGVSSASAIFQSVMDQLLSGLSGVICRVDDILITGKDDAEHMSRVWEVVHRLEQAGFRCRLDKCHFMVPSVVYIGHVLSKQGIQPVCSKVETLVQAPYPKNRDELVAFLGAMQYYARYLPNLHTVIEPLNRLWSKDTPWTLGEAEKSSFDKLKGLLSSDQVLTFYNPDLELKLDTDASSVGLGAVLSHIESNGNEKPIEFISRTLQKAERNYSQIEHEALAIVWAVRKFHRYVYARPFKLCTDHKPLEIIFDPHKALSEVITSRLQRWALFLTSYQYKVQYRSTKKHCNADVCSRFPLPNVTDPEGEDIYAVEADDSIFSVKIGSDKPLLDSSLIARHTRVDPILSKVLHFTLEGWRDPLNDEKLKSYHQKKDEITVDTNCLLWGSRVIIPKTMQQSVLELLHATHMGMVSMKSLARGYVWWPGMDNEIEGIAKRCEACQKNQRKPKASIPHPWVAPSEPWERLHLDFAGPFLGWMWLILIDAYSKWIEIVKMSNTNSGSTIKALRDIFSRFGLPQSIVSDNGPQLISIEMSQFMKKNGIHHILIPSYHPASNGQAESIVGKFKTGMKKMLVFNPDLAYNLSTWLMT